jgi:acetyl esterase/lipase
VVWAIAYRHAPRYRFPAQIEDVQAALAFIQQHATEYETDLERIALLGRSAGAHLAMLAAYRPDAPRIRAVVNYYGPVNLTKGYYDLPHPDPIDVRAVLKAFLGGSPDELPELYRQASPISYVSQPQPPSLLVYGGQDHIIQAKFGRTLGDRLQAVGSQVIFLEIPWAEHAFDAVFNGVSNQLALYYTERFLAWALQL